jgi:hypothetical protein
MIILREVQNKKHKYMYSHLPEYSHDWSKHVGRLIQTPTTYLCRFIGIKVKANPVHAPRAPGV